MFWYLTFGKYVYVLGIYLGVKLLDPRRCLCSASVDAVRALFCTCLLWPKHLPCHLSESSQNPFRILLLSLRCCWRHWGFKVVNKLCKVPYYLDWSRDENPAWLDFKACCCCRCFKWCPPISFWSQILNHARLFSYDLRINGSAFPSNAIYFIGNISSYKNLWCVYCLDMLGKEKDAKW